MPAGYQNHQELFLPFKIINVQIKFLSNLTKVVVTQVWSTYYDSLISVSQASSSSDSLDGPCVDYAKSYDAVVFDVLKVTPEEFAVSILQLSLNICAV